MPQNALMDSAIRAPGSHPYRAGFPTLPVIAAHPELAVGRGCVGEPAIPGIEKSNWQGKRIRGFDLH
jgi:hypothetical protein